MAEGCNLSDEDELLREALKRTKPVLCDRLPIELLPTVLEGESVIGGMECKLIKEERNSVERSLKLLELMEKKSIPVIRRFLEALKSKSDFCGYEYLADMVYSERAALVEKKAATTETVVTSTPTPSTKRVARQHPYNIAVKRRGTAGKRKRRAPSPELVYVPIFTELETEFALLAAATSEAIRKLDPHSFHDLLYFLRHLPQVDEGVYPNCSEPLSLQDLLIMLEESWNFANFHLADAIARFFGDLYKDDTLAARVASYKKFLQKELPVALIQCKKKRVRPKPLKSRALLALVSPEDQKGFYLQQILTCRQFLIHSLGIKAALFVGFDEGGSIRVFFSIPRAVVWRLVPILQTRLSVLCGMRITRVQVIGQFVVETESGKLTYWDQEVESGAGASALWKRKMSKRMQEMECALIQVQRHLESALAENAVELDQLRQERMALQLKLQSSKAEVDTLKKRLEVVAQFREVHSIAVQPGSEEVEHPTPLPPPLPPPTPPTPPTASTPPAQEESEPLLPIAGISYSRVVVPSLQVQLDDWCLPQPQSNVDHSHAFEILDCLERKELITPEESVSLAGGAPDRTWADSLVHVLQQKSVQVIDAARDALAPFQDTNSILMALKCYSLLYRRGLLKVDDFTSPLISAVASSWAETLFLVQLSKRLDVLEATANVLLEVGAPLDIISWFKVVASLVKEDLIAKDIFYFPPAISFKRILFEQLNNKSWTTVDRCAGILAQHGKAEYAEALIRLKKCVDISLVPSTIFDSLHNHAKLDDPTAVGVPQFVLYHASDFSPAKVKKVAKLFDGYGYHSLASSLKEVASLSEQMRNPVDLLNRFSPQIQSSILRSLSLPVTSERLHVVYLLSDQNLATKDECSTMLAAILEQTFGQSVLRIQSTKTLDVLTKTADILEECTSFPTPAKQLRVLITFVKQLSLTAAERCRPQFRDLTSDMEATYRQWMGSLAGVVATRPAEDVEKAAAIFEQYNEPFLASRLRLLSRLVHEQLLNKEERQRVVEFAFDHTLASRWEAFLLQLQRKKGKPTLVQTEEILQSLTQDV